MRIFTVIAADRAVAVVRADSDGEAIEQALRLWAVEAPHAATPRGLAVREPNDEEMVGWLERREDFWLRDGQAQLIAD